MSAAIVRKSLELVDPSFKTHTSAQKKLKKEKGVFGLVPENHKLISKSNRRKGKVEKRNLLSTKTKLTVAEARKNYKSKDQILRENLKKIELIRQVSKIELDKETTSKIIERAVTKRPIKKKLKSKKVKKTVFSEEDFKKFEEEYFDE